MPSPTGAVSAGLLASLNGVARKVGGGTNDIDTALASGNKLAEVTKHCVEFQLADCQQSNNVLKSKYVFLDTKVRHHLQKPKSPPIFLKICSFCQLSHLIFLI